jgi:methylenetetrahydrofolate dehydrogenase (NADP+)/methenyltetrahydrofolate cyclohydrolase
MAEIWKGAPVAAAISGSLVPRVEQLKKGGILPTLAIVRVGERADDLSYERGVAKRAEKIGIAVENRVLPQAASTAELMAQIDALNRDPAVHGILLLRPLPKGMDEAAVCQAVDPCKDVDGVTDASAAGVFTGSGTGFAPCTAQACLEILDYYGSSPAGKQAVVIGRSGVVGRPAALLLLHRNATVTVCHTKTVDVSAVARQAQILIAAAGKAEMVTRDYLSAGQIVIDAGIHQRADGTLCGDVNFADAAELVQAVTPVPGGVGSVTTAVLCRHVVEAAGRG